MELQGTATKEERTGKRGEERSCKGCSEESPLKQRGDGRVGPAPKKMGRRLYRGARQGSRLTQSSRKYARGRDQAKRKRKVLCQDAEIIEKEETGRKNKEKDKGIRPTRSDGNLTGERSEGSKRRITFSNNAASPREKGFGRFGQLGSTG